MPSTGLKISCPVDGCFNRNRGKPCFRYVAHETHKIAVRFEMKHNVPNDNINAGTGNYLVPALILFIQFHSASVSMMT